MNINNNLTNSQARNYVPTEDYVTLHKRFSLESKKPKLLAYQRALNRVVTDGRGKAHTIAIAIVSDLIYATLHDKLEFDDTFRIRYSDYYDVDGYHKSHSTIQRAVNHLGRLEITKKEQKSFKYKSNGKTLHCANAVHLKLDVEKLLELAPTLKFQFSDYLVRAGILSSQDEQIIRSKCTDVTEYNNNSLASEPVENFLKVKEEVLKEGNTELRTTTADKPTFVNKLLCTEFLKTITDEELSQIHLRSNTKFSAQDIEDIAYRMGERQPSKYGNSFALSSRKSFITYFTEKVLPREKQQIMLKDIPATPASAGEIDTSCIDVNTTLGKLQQNAVEWYSKGVYQSWFKCLSIVSESDSEIIIDCPNSIVAEYIKWDYYKAIEEYSNKVKDSRYWVVSGSKLIIGLNE